MLPSKYSRSGRIFIDQFRVADQPPPQPILARLVLGTGGRVVQRLVRRVRPVVGHTRFRASRIGQTGAVHVVPPALVGVRGYAEAQARLERRRPPLADDVPVRAGPHGVPRVGAGVPVVEVVVVGGQRHEVFRPGGLVLLHQGVGIELLRLPRGDHVLVAEPRKDAHSAPGASCSRLTPACTCRWRSCC